MNNELYHHGIKGMRWGIRKDKRKSGGLKKKIGKKIRSLRNRFRNSTGSRKSKALSNYRKKDINRMSNKELQNAINRMNLEKQYRSLTSRDFKQGSRIAKDILAYASIPMSAITIYGGYKKLFSKKKDKE